MQTSIVIPTYRRPEDLRRCLASIRRSERTPDEVLVVHRHDDVATQAVIAEEQVSSLSYILKPVQVSRPGAVAAYNAGLDAAKGEIVAIIDDDTVIHVDWLAKLVSTYASQPDVGGVGGRDIMHLEGYSLEPNQPIVGMIQSFGRMIGNHHAGYGGARDVHVLKGANMSFRRGAIEGIRFDHRLLGNGAQVHLEVGLCTAVRQAGWRLVYDPDILLDHYPSVRHDSDKRSGFSAEAHFNKAHNEQLAILDSLSFPGRAMFIAWGFIVGSHDVPGLAQIPRDLWSTRAHPLPRLWQSWRGRIAGTRTWLRSFKARKSL